MDRDATLSDSIELSRWLGAAQHDGTILGEGNALALLDDNTFLEKASRTLPGSAEAGVYVEVHWSAVLAMLVGRETRR